MAESEGYPSYQGYGGYGQPMDPQAMRARLAMAMLQQGSESTPIRSPWQGAARMSNALFGALMMRQMQDKQQENSQAIQDQFNAARAGGFGMGGAPGGFSGGAPGGFSGGAGSPGLPAQPGALSDLANDPDIMRGVQNAASNGLPDSATIGQSLAAGGHPPSQMGPPMPAMTPNNSAGGQSPGNWVPMAPGGMPPSMTSQAGPNAFLHNSVAGPGAPSQIAPDAAAINAAHVTPPGMLAGGGNPQGAPSQPLVPGPGVLNPATMGASAPGALNPAELAMFQQDMQAVPGTPAGGGGGGPLMGRLTSMGYSPVAAAGIVGNFQQESSLNPGIIGDQGTSGGLGQWHGSRFTNLQNFAQQQGGSWKDPNVQLAFADQEIKSDPQLYQSLNGAKTPQEAALIFQNGFEKPAPATANTSGRQAYAAQALGGGQGSALAFDGGQTPPPPAAPALGAIQNAAGPPGAVPGSMQPHMMVAGPGAPSNPGGNIMSPQPQGAGPPPMPPGAGGGGNPLSALGSMFGMGNPSSPQGGNGPAPAGGGAPGGGQGMPGVDPQVLMRVAMDPYSSPQARQMAGQLLQYYMPHPPEWRTNPGTNDQQAYNPMTGQPIQGMFRPGPHETSVQDIGTDMAGVKHQGIFDKNTGKLIQVLDPNSPNGVAQSGGASMMTNPMPGASAPSPAQLGGGKPKTWAPGQEIDPAIDQNLQGLAMRYASGNQQAAGEIYQYAKALLSGNQQFVSAGAVAKSPIVMAGETIARQLDPDGMPQTRFDTIKANADTSSPTALGGQRMAAQTSVRHLGSLAEASDLLANQGQVSSSEMGAELQNWAQRNLGGASSKFTDASQAYNAALVPVLGEIDKLYKGGQATEGEIMEMKNNLAPTASPDARRAALTMLGGLLQDKVQVLQDTWHMGTGKNFPDLPIIDQRGQEGLDYMKKWGPNAPPVAPGGAQAAPAPQGFSHQGTAGGPVIIKSDEDYNRLPSGAKFVGPDGKTRAKP